MFVLVRVTMNAPLVWVSLAWITGNQYTYHCQCSLRVGGGRSNFAFSSRLCWLSLQHAQYCCCYHYNIMKFFTHNKYEQVCNKQFTNDDFILRSSSRDLLQRLLLLPGLIRRLDLCLSQPLTWAATRITDTLYFSNWFSITHMSTELAVHSTFVN